MSDWSELVFVLICGFAAGWALSVVGRIDRTVRLVARRQSIMLDKIDPGPSASIEAADPVADAIEDELYRSAVARMEAAERREDNAERAGSLEALGKAGRR